MPFRYVDEDAEWSNGEDGANSSKLCCRSRNPNAEATSAIWIARFGSEVIDRCRVAVFGEAVTTAGAVGIEADMELDRRTGWACCEVDLDSVVC